MKVEFLSNYWDLGKWPFDMVLGNAVEQIILSAITQHVQDSQVTRFTQCGFLKGRSCLTNLVFFYVTVPCFFDEGKAVDVVNLDFSKAFDSFPLVFFLGKTGCLWLGWAYAALDKKKLAGWWVPKSCDEWS